MSDIKDELLRLSLRRDLTPDEELRIEAVLAAHPELRPQWEKDRAFGGALRHLPDVPLASNFTARVLQAIDAEDAREQREMTRPSAWRRLAARFKPRLSWAALLLAAAGLAVYQHHSAQRQEFVVDAQGVARTLAVVPDPKLLQDFDAINQFREVSAASDDQLLTVLQ